MHRKVSIAVFAILIMFLFGFFSFVAGQKETKSPPEKAQGAINKTMESAGDQIAHGKYLVTMGGCNDCHSPKTSMMPIPQPDNSRLLSGHPASDNPPNIPVGVIGPNNWGALASNDMTAWAGPWGVSFTFNLTPDDATGIGVWTESSFLQAMHTGKHMGTGREILPPMPWYEIGKAKDSDLKAMFAYLKSLKPVSNQVPQPMPPTSMNGK
jgi:hypothetical protein